MKKTSVTAELTQTDMINICRGAGFYGSGGGGSVEQTYQIINNIWDPTKLPNKQKVILTNPNDVADTNNLASVAMIGSPSTSKKVDNWYKYASVNSLKLLSQKTGKTIQQVVAVEVGSVNITVPMIVAAITGMPYVDCTGTPRSVPKLQNTTYAANGIASSPAAFASDDETSATEYIVAEGVVDVDSLSRSVLQSPEFNQSAGFSNFLMTGKQMKVAGCLGWVTKAKELGEQFASAKEKNKKQGAKKGANILKAVNTHLEKVSLQAYLLAEGTITKISTVSSGGFDATTITITTANDVVTVIALNENLIAWSAATSSPIAMAPDLISYVDYEGKVYSNVDIQEGQTIALIGTVVDPSMRNPKIIAAFLEELNAMGYYGPYVPIEKIHG